MDIELAGLGIVGITLISWFVSRPLDTFTAGVIIGLSLYCVIRFAMTTKHRGGRP